MPTFAHSQSSSCACDSLLVRLIIFGNACANTQAPAHADIKNSFAITKKDGTIERSRPMFANVTSVRFVSYISPYLQTCVHQCVYVHLVCLCVRVSTNQTSVECGKMSLVIFEEMSLLIFHLLHSLSFFNSLLASMPM
jgi:hypothetical protein